MRTILIDDEIPCMASLQIQLMENCPELTIIGVYNEASTALRAIQTLKPDLVFLDIEMPEMNAFQLLDLLKNAGFMVIFTTAYNQFAVKAFRYSAIDYLLKPIDDDELISAVAKAKQQKTQEMQWEILESHWHHPHKTPDKIALSFQDGYIFVNPQEIIYCEADSNYTKCHLQNGQTTLSSKTLKEVEDLLHNLGFFRIHKQYLINVNQVKKFNKVGSYVVMNNGIDLTIARNRKDDFQNYILKI
ncbi:MAG: LytTR family DNA-binding domain-containing protein [Microscillaceae bacterium]|jgi:two-component system LytT family response regulator|nr:LytTR family DNA-binding domain-containing protein [Microscillaceae bacterium]